MKNGGGKTLRPKRALDVKRVSTHQFVRDKVILLLRSSYSQRVCAFYARHDSEGDDGRKDACLNLGYRAEFKKRSSEIHDEINSY